MYNNLCTIKGNIGNITVYREEGKTAFAVFTIAGNINYTDEEEQRECLTVWHSVHCFAEKVDSVEKQLQQGNAVRIFGALRYSKPKDEKYQQKGYIALKRFEQLHRSATSTNAALEADDLIEA